MISSLLTGDYRAISFMPAQDPLEARGQAVKALRNSASKNGKVLGSSLRNARGSNHIPSSAG